MESIYSPAQLFISFDGRAPPAVVVAEAPDVVGLEALAGVAGAVLSVAQLEGPSVAVVVAVVGGVLAQPVPVDADVAAVEPALASVPVVAVYATAQPVPVVACVVVAEPALAALVSVAADVEFAELVLARGASGHLPSGAGGALDQPVLVDVDVAGPHRVVSATVLSAVFQVSGSQAAFDDQAVAHELVRSVSDDQAVVVQPVFGGLAVVHV